jgi:hypothetical protein
VLKISHRVIFSCVYWSYSPKVLSLLRKQSQADIFAG